MTTYLYHCSRCDQMMEHDFCMGEAANTVRCTKCNRNSPRHWSCNVIIPDQHKATPAKNPSRTIDKPTPKKKTTKKTTKKRGTK